MQILVTGGAGFIGSHLCDALLKEEENHVTAIDNLQLGRLSNIEHLSNHDRFKFEEVDLLDLPAITNVFESNHFDIVYHLAANSDIAISHQKPKVDLDSTFLTTYRVLDMMRLYGTKKIIFASTSAIYGNPNGMQLTEDFGPLMPVSHYGAGKLASEAFISSFAENYGLQAWIVRFPNVVGERATHGAIFDFINKAQSTSDHLEVLGNGEQNKPYVYVKDLVEAILFVVANSKDQVNIFNLGVDTRTKVSRMAEIVLDELNSNKPIRYTGGAQGWVGDVPAFEYNLQKIWNLGWKASLSSDEAVRKSVQEILK